jgi:NADP-dependent 3-hydroxy acid dehydrogenase YdfG
MTKVTGNGSKVAIITGGGSGLGLAIATKFVENNIITIITGRDATKLEAAKSSLG